MSPRAIAVASCSHDAFTTATPSSTLCSLSNLRRQFRSTARRHPAQTDDGGRTPCRTRWRRRCAICTRFRGDAQMSTRLGGGSPSSTRADTAAGDAAASGAARSKRAVRAAGHRPVAGTAPHAARRRGTRSGTRAAARRNRGAAARDAIDELPPDYRTVVMTQRFEGRRAGRRDLRSGWGSRRTPPSCACCARIAALRSLLARASNTSGRPSIGPSPVSLIGSGSCMKSSGGPFQPPRASAATAGQRPPSIARNPSHLRQSARARPIRSCRCTVHRNRLDPPTNPRVPIAEERQVIVAGELDEPRAGDAIGQVACALIGTARSPRRCRISARVRIRTQASRTSRSALICASATAVAADALMWR